jgi:acyl-CoA thioesterase FadM
LTRSSLPRYSLQVAHRPERDGRLITDPHVPFFLALEAAADAWSLALAEFCEDILLPSDVGVVNVTSDFRHELFVGLLHVDVSLQSIGVSSVTFIMRLFQAEQCAGSVRLVVAKVNEARTQSVALTAVERAALETIPRTDSGPPMAPPG